MRSNQELTNELVEQGHLKTPRLIAAFLAIDRAYFVPEKLRPRAYENDSLPLGFEQTISQPMVVAFMLELLQVQKGEKILDIGAGSGYTSALLGFLVGEKGKVISIERIKKLKNKASQNISQYNFMRKGRVKLIWGNGAKGFKKEAPFDKILASAAALEIPLSWKKQLKIGGRLVAPVSDSIQVLEKKSVNKFRVQTFEGFSFVPLINPS